MDDCHSLQKRSTLLKLGALSLSPWIPSSLFASSIHALPRNALVIGNSAYPDMPLLNPSNDANAIGAELKRLGFDVDLQINARRDAMENAMANFSNLLSKTKSVGLFYFAGHGLQLDWRNYLVPIDARLDKADDVPRQAVEIGSLLSRLGKAGNPLNIVILDACRDNPFGSEKKTGKGLSQMDAPIGTLLAYATAPGNVASDGSGKNGLYTENLLKEMSAPGAKIEDVFKRVRLAVRRTSQGQQIPWESTSLEDDFYFIPPADLRKRSQDELDRLFAQEKSEWDKAEASGDPSVLTAYLKAYPSGRFAEIAQAVLDRLLAKRGEKKVAIVSSEKNPFSKGSASAGQFRLGDRFEYRVIDLYTKAETRRDIETVTDFTDSEVIFSNGTVTDLLGNWRKAQNGFSYEDNQVFAADYSIGKVWNTRYDFYHPDGRPHAAELECKVVGKESITVPAGTFETFRVDCLGFFKGGRRIQNTYWIAPGIVPRFIAFNERHTMTQGKVSLADRMELVSYTPAS